MSNCNRAATPTEVGLKLVRNLDEKKVDSHLYKQIVGSLMYITGTRPDIMHAVSLNSKYMEMHAVSLISRYMENPKESHLLDTKRILRYLRGTTSFGIFYKKGEKSDLIGYTDSDYAGDIDDRKSTSGYVFMPGSGAISWSSKKQEIVAATACACQAIWLRRILEGLNFVQEREVDATAIYCDNSSAIKLSKDPVLYGRRKKQAHRREISFYQESHKGWSN